MELKLARPLFAGNCRALYLRRLSGQTLSRKGPRVNADSLTFLKRLLDTPAPSGFEAPAARVWREEAARFADVVDVDVSGNSWATLNPDGYPRVMLAGHIDEIGLMVTHVDEE